MRSKIRGPTQEFRVRHPDTGEMMTLVREETMTGPPLWALAGIFVLAAAWYMFWFGLGTYSMAGWIGWDLLYPSLPLAAVSTLRFAARQREEFASEHSWPSPVMRQRGWVLVVFALLAAVLGGWAGRLFNHIPAVWALGINDAAIVTIAGAWQMLQSVRKIPPMAD